MSNLPEQDVLYPPLQAALGKGDVEAIWRLCDQHTRSLWCALGHVNDSCALLPWADLPDDGSRVRLTASLGVIRSFLRGFKATFEEMER